jgi:uncharacterized SAM-binding protein YcdF (DUF218 family)
MSRTGILDDLALLLTVYRGADFVQEGNDGVKAAVIMGAQVLKGGRPSQTLEARVRHAARLYHEGDLDLLIPTGGLGEHPPKEADLMTCMLTALDVPPQAILPEDAALNTWGSALEVLRLTREKEMKRVRVVTDPLHCVRTVWAFEEAGISAIAEPVYESPMWSKPWSRRGQLVREAVALIWYRLKYGAR